MTINKKILIFTATYNEAENIGRLLEKLIQQSNNAHILVIDDNSPDRTAEIVESYQKNNQSIFLIKREGKLGLDTAHKKAYDFALTNNYDYLITMDADLSHDPSEINIFIKYLENYDFVIGSRYIDGGKCLMKGKRLVLSKFGNKLIKSLLNINCNEFTTSYRGFNIRSLKNFNLTMVNAKGYSFFMETVFRIFSSKFKVKEIPITFSDRQKGYSKIPKIEIFRTLKNLVLLKFKKLR